MVRRAMTMTALLLVSGTALAAEDTVRRAQRCTSVADSLERLVCYDRIFGTDRAGTAAGLGDSAVTAQAAPAAPVSPPAATVATPGTSASAAPGFGAEQIRRPGSQDEETERTLTASVKELRETRQNVFRITLDNDQVWQQMDMDSLFHVRVGDTVEINRGRMGGYRMARKSRGGSGRVRVNRLK